MGTVLVIGKLKSMVNEALECFGFRIVRTNQDDPTGADPGLRQILDRLGVLVAFDVGAHAGEYATRLRNIGYRGRIISFEPQTEAFAALSKRAMLDPYWEVHRLALGDQEGEKLMNISQNSVSSSLLPILPNILTVEPTIAGIGTERVRVAVLDRIYRNLTDTSEHKAFLKIDAQGYEPAVLAGAREFLSCCVAVQLELALIPSYQNQTLLPEMIGLMRKREFELVYLERGFSDERTGYLIEADGIFVRAELLERDFPRSIIVDSVPSQTG
jgi:FkbM family methyltransferase